MRKRIVFVLFLLLSIAFIGEVKAYDPQPCQNYDSYAKEMHVYVTLNSGFKSATELKNITGIVSTDDRVSFVAYTGDINNSGTKSSFERDKKVTGVTDLTDYYSFNTTNTVKVRNRAMLNPLPDFTYNGVSYSFGGWYYDAEFKNKVTVESALDLNLDARRNGASNVSSSTGGNGNNYSCPLNPDQATSAYPYDTDNNNFVLHAKWNVTSGTKPTCTAVANTKKTDLFHCSDGSCATPKLILINAASTVSSTKPTTKTHKIVGEIATLIAEETTIEVPTAEYEGYRFDGWYYDMEFRKPIPESGQYKDIVSWVPNLVDYNGCTISWSHILLYPKWTYIEESASANSIEIHLENNFGTGSTEISKPLTDSSTLTLLPIPTRDNYIFEGWYYDGKFQNRVEGKYVKDIDVSKLTYTYRYVGENGKYYKLYAKWAKYKDLNGIRVSGFEDSLPTLNQITVSSFVVDSSLASANNISSNISAGYDITLKDSAGTIIQPNGKAIVALPLNGMNAYKVKVFYYDDTKLVEMPVDRIDGNYVYFFTTHFSKYIIAETDGSGGGTNPDPQTPTNEITDIRIISPSSKTASLSFNKNVTSYNIGDVDNDVTSITFNISTTGSAALTVNGSNGSVCQLTSAGVNVCNIAYGSSQYTVTVNRRRSPNLSSISVVNYTLNHAFDNTYSGDYTVVENVTASTIQFQIIKGDNEQVVTVNGYDSFNCNLVIGSNTCTVKSQIDETSNYREYKFIVVRAAEENPSDSEAKITKIVYGGTNYTPDSNNNFEITNFSPTDRSISVSVCSSVGTKIDGVPISASSGCMTKSYTLSDSLDTITNNILVKSKNDVNEATYTLTVKRRIKSNDNTLKALRAYLPNSSVNKISGFSKTNTNYDITVEDNTTYIVIEFETTDNYAKVTTNSVNSNTGSFNCQVSKTGSKSCTISVQAEDSSVKNYYVNVTYPVPEANNDASLKSLTAKDSKNNNISFSFSSDDSVQSSFNVENDISYVVFTPVLNVPSGASIVTEQSNLTCNLPNVGTNYCYIKTTAAGGGTKTYTILVNRNPKGEIVDENDILPVDICLNNQCLEKDRVAELTLYERKENGHPTYSARVDSSVESVIFKLNSNKVKNAQFTSSSAQSCDLIAGRENKCTIDIQLANGNRTYVIYITRAAEDVTLSDDARLNSVSISPSGATLVEEFNMDKSGLYHIKANYDVNSITFSPTFHVDGATIISSESNVTCNLAEGDNECHLAVLAPDGKTKKYYYFLVKRYSETEDPSKDKIVPLNMCTEVGCANDSIITFKKSADLDDNGNPIYVASVDYSAEKVYFSINGTELDSIVNTIVSGAVCDLNTIGLNTCTVVVLEGGEPGHERTYVFKVTRNSPSDNPTINPNLDPCLSDPDSKECKVKLCTDDPSKCDTTKPTDTGAFALSTILGLGTLVGIVYLFRNKFRNKIYKI